jgi:hypothetical protein
MLLVFTLAVGLFYGRFVVPWALAPDSRDAQLQQLREENELLRDQVGELRKKDAMWRIQWDLEQLTRNEAGSRGSRRPQYFPTSTPFPLKRELAPLPDQGSETASDSVSPP